MTPASACPAQVCEQLSLLLRESRYGAFVRLLNESLREFGPSAEIYRYAADYSRRIDNPAQTQRFLLQWAAVAPQDPSPCLQLADLLAQAGRTDQVVEALDMAEKAGADPLQMAVRRIQVLLAGRQYAQAAELAAATLAGQPPVVPTAKLLSGLSVLAANLAAAAGRPDLDGLVRRLAGLSGELRADAAGLLLAAGGTARRLHSQVSSSTIDQLTKGIHTSGCGCVIGAAELLDMVRPASQVQDGSFYGSRLRIYVVEPDDAQIVLALATSDLRDVLADQSITWLAGPTAIQDLANLLARREDEPPTAFTVSPNPQIQQVVQEAYEARVRKTEAHLRESAAYYAGLGRQHWDDILGERPSRPPRILLITTEFSSFMKFSIRDLAAAFGRLGWVPQVLKESQPTERILAPTVAKTVASFRPDLIWQINYTRASWKDAVPDGVPFVCWDQDKMLHMMNAEQARAQGRFDFVAYLGSGLVYIRAHGYPREQLIPLSMCVDPSLFCPDPATVPDTDVCYVSHHGRTLERRIQQILEMVPREQEGRFLPLVQEYAARLERFFGETGCPLRPGECREVLVEICKNRQVQFEAKDLDTLADCLYRLVANTVWRHQAIQMVAACDVNLKLYGQGWEENPEFSRFACGTVEHGRPLADVLRSSRVALQVVFSGNEHQRLWEAAACGTIVLMRWHPGDEVSTVLRTWLDRLGGGMGRPLHEVVPESERQSAVGRLVYGFIRTNMVGEDGIVTPMALECAQHAASFACVRDKLGDAYADMAFRDQQDLRAKLGRILHDPSHRQRLRENLLAAAHQHIYDVQLPRVIRTIRQRLLA